MNDNNNDNSYGGYGSNDTDSGDNSYGGYSGDDVGNGYGSDDTSDGYGGDGWGGTGDDADGGWGNTGEENGGYGNDDSDDNSYGGYSGDDIGSGYGNDDTNDGYGGYSGDDDGGYGADNDSSEGVGGWGGFGQEVDSAELSDENDSSWGGFDDDAVGGWSNDGEETGGWGGIGSWGGFSQEIDSAELSDEEDGGLDAFDDDAIDAWSGFKDTDMETTETYGAALAATSWAPSKDETSWCKNIMTAIDNEAIDKMIDEAYSSKGTVRGALSKTVGRAGVTSALFSANDIYQDLAGYKYNDVTTEYKAAAIDTFAAVMSAGVGIGVAGIFAAAAAPEILAVGAGIVLGSIIGEGIDKAADSVKDKYCGKPNEGN